VTLRDFSEKLAAFATVLWVGGMWAIGYLAVPVLFQTLTDRQMAGLLAGKMFTLMAFVGLVCAVYLLVNQWWIFGKTAWMEATFRVTLVMLVLLLLGQFVLQPMMADLKLRALPLDVMQGGLASEFKALHGIASVLYLIQSLLGLVLVVRLKRGVHAK
jgi:hypothetical protein